MVRSAKKLAWIVLAFASVMPAAVSQTGVAGTVSSVQGTVDALARAGIVVGPYQVEFLSGIRSARESANVRVVSVTSSSSGTAKVKMRCQDNRECLPFYVLVHQIDGVKLGSSRAAVVPETTPVSPKNVIRSGDHATLVLETPDARMSFPVICLQSGVRGQRIRAASPDRRQFYYAEVVAPGMLKGSL